MTTTEKYRLSLKEYYLIFLKGNEYQMHRLVNIKRNTKEAISFIRKYDNGYFNPTPFSEY